MKAFDLSSMSEDRLGVTERLTNPPALLCDLTNPRAITGLGATEGLLDFFSHELLADELLLNFFLRSMAAFSAFSCLEATEGNELVLLSDFAVYEVADRLSTARDSQFDGTPPEFGKDRLLAVFNLSSEPLVATFLSLTPKWLAEPSAAEVSVMVMLGTEIRLD